MPDIIWIGVGNVAELLWISRPKVQAMAKAGEIPAYRIGKSYRFDRAEIEQQWIAAQKIAPNGEDR